MFEDELDDEPGDLEILDHGLKDQLQMRMVLPVDAAGEFDDDEIAQFFELAYEKMYGPSEIAWALNWSPRKLKQFLADDERAELLEFAKEALNEGMERAVYIAGRRGNITAARLWLFCQARHRGWADTRQVHVTAQSRAEVLVSVAQGVRETLNAGIIEHGEDAVLALQTAYVDIDDPDIVDAEVVDAD
jgi:hypothetical protein